MPAIKVKVKQTVLVMDLPKSVDALVAKVRNYALNVKNNPLLFSTLTPIYSVVNTACQTLVDAELAFKNGTGLSGPRDEAEIAVRNLGNNWGSQVQVMVRNTVGLDAQNTLIQAFGGRAKVNGVFNKPLFSGVNTSAGAVTLKKRKIPGGTNEYMISYDAGLTWSMLFATHLNEIPVSGLALKSSPLFRTRSTVGLVQGGWIMIEVYIEK
jgi:hypothetical protein